jgi:hypothetical protein
MTWCGPMRSDRKRPEARSSRAKSGRRCLTYGDTIPRESESSRR